MAAAPLVGSLVRETRKRIGTTQADLARACEISPSYLNLIEHNRRKIGGALLNRIANELGVEPSALSTGAGGALVKALESASSKHERAGAEMERLEEFAGRFPGWARLVAAQQKSEARLEETVRRLSDRLAHDPFLSAAIHDLLTGVTSIRSTSTILSENKALEPEWQARFHRNIHEDSERLSQSVEALVRQIDGGGPKDREALPEEAVDAWLMAREWCVPELEQGQTSAEKVARDAGLSPEAEEQLRRALSLYVADVEALPLGRLIAALETTSDAFALMQSLDVGAPVLFRRLAALQADAFPDRQARGVVGCDGAGALIFRKPIPGFDLPHVGSACALWPLFEALTRPGAPVVRTVAVAGRDPRLFRLSALADMRYPDGPSAAPILSSWMLIESERGTPTGREPSVGATCRICAANDCSARREPPLVRTQEV